MQLLHNNTFRFKVSPTGAKFSLSIRHIKVKNAFSSLPMGPGWGVASKPPCAPLAEALDPSATPNTHLAKCSWNNVPKSQPRDDEAATELNYQRQFSKLHHFPRLLQSFGCQWRHLESMRAVRFDEAFTYTSIASLVIVKMYCPL